MDDMAMTGKRHPYSSDFKIGLDKDLKIVAYEATFYQNAGAAADFRRLFWSELYFIAQEVILFPMLLQLLIVAAQISRPIRLSEDLADRRESL